jgi:ACS family glucarate transporter-like MFS transporter
MAWKDTSHPAGSPKIPARAFVYALLFIMMAINYVDRVNLSIAAGTIAKELTLSPVQLGWLFSAFLWSYIVCLIPGGFLADRFGFRYMPAVVVAFWSLATASTAAAYGLIALLAARICLGAGEAGAWPSATRAVRAWAPRSEYGLAISSISLGQSFVGWLVRDFGWRASFVMTGALGAIWALVWLATVRGPGEAKWLGDGERRLILATRDERPVGDTGSGGYLGLIGSPAIWALTLSQDCLVYAYYMLLTWLPNYLQTQRGIAIFGSGMYTAIIYGTAVVGSILLARVTDRIFTIEALKAGARRIAVVISFVPAMSMAATPWLTSTWLVVVVLTIAVTFLANAISLNAVLCNDLVRAPGDAGRAIALFTSGSNVIGVSAPIVTGYIVSSSQAFDAAFALTGAVLVLGAIILLVFARGGIGTKRELP